MRSLFGRIIVYSFITLVLSAPVFARAQDNLSPEERSSLTKQLDQLEKEAANLDQNIQEIQGQARTLKNEIALMDNEIKRRELEIRRLTLVIKQTETDITRKISNIRQTTTKIGVTQKELGAAVKELAQRGSENLLELMLKNQSLSEFFLVLNNNEKLQETIQNKIVELRDYKKSLEREKVELEDF